MAAEGAGIGVFGASIARQCLERRRLDEIVALGAGPDHGSAFPGPEVGDRQSQRIAFD